MRQLLVATSNAHKAAEIQAMLGGAWQVADLRSFPQVPPAEEIGDTFAENAIIKAESVSRAVPELLVLSDDSGLEVDALGEAPGVRSARFAGEGATDADNRAKLKKELAALPGGPKPHPAARFHCCVAAAKGGRVLRTFHGTVEGTIIPQERGSAGFGYDSLFVPDGHEQTFGELSAEVKNRLSHRARALAQVIEWLAAMD